MAFEENKGPTEEEGLNGDPGLKKFGRMVRMFREGFLSVCVYKNVYERKTFYDVVIYRKIRVEGGGHDYKRGANLKPKDLAVLIKLLAEVEDFLRANNSQENMSQ